VAESRVANRTNLRFFAPSARINQSPCYSPLVIEIGGTAEGMTREGLESLLVGDLGRDMPRSMIPAPRVRSESFSNIAKPSPMTKTIERLGKAHAMPCALSRHDRSGSKPAKIRNSAVR